MLHEATTEPPWIRHKFPHGLRTARARPPRTSPDATGVPPGDSWAPPWGFFGVCKASGPSGGFLGPSRAAFGVFVVAPAQKETCLGLFGPPGCLLGRLVPLPGGQRGAVLGSRVMGLTGFDSLLTVLLRALRANRHIGAGLLDSLGGDASGSTSAFGLPALGLGFQIWGAGSLTSCLLDGWA